MLTVVAYRIAIDSSLPPLNYMTRMDYFLLACQVFVFGAFIVVVAIHVLYSIDSKETRAIAARLTVQCRWLSPLLLIVASLLLTFLPASCGGWVMAGAGLLFGAWIMPPPGHFHVWWGAMVHPEKMAQQAGGAHSPGHVGAEEDHGPLRIKSNRQSSAA
jgi:hypothetical protein